MRFEKFQNRLKSTITSICFEQMRLCMTRERMAVFSKFLTRILHAVMARRSYEKERVTPFVYVFIEWGRNKRVVILISFT